MRWCLVVLLSATALAGCSASPPKSQAAGGEPRLVARGGQPCGTWSGPTWTGTRWTGPTGDVCAGLGPADTQTAASAGAGRALSRTLASRQAANEAAKARTTARPLSQLVTVQARIDAALRADPHSSGGFSTGLDVSAGSRSGWVVLTVPTQDVSEGQRSLADRLQREFGDEAVVWRGGSGPSWLPATWP